MIFSKDDFLWRLFPNICAPSSLIMFPGIQKHKQTMKFIYTKKGNNLSYHSSSKPSLSCWLKWNHWDKKLQCHQFCSLSKASLHLIWIINQMTMKYKHSRLSSWRVELHVSPSAKSAIESSSSAFPVDSNKWGKDSLRSYTKNLPPRSKTWSVVLLFNAEEMDERPSFWIWQSVPHKGVSISWQGI